jgi:tetratricopeptide (TPR) repeat protein
VRFVSSLISCALLLWTAPVQAQSTPAERAKEYAAAGLEAVDSGDFIAAVEAFKKAYRTDRKPKFLFNIGRAYHVMGKFRLALDFYERFLRENKSKKKAVRGAEIVGELRRQMARLTILVDIPKAALSVDGDLELCFLNAPCMLDPGEHQIEVGADGYAPGRRRLRLEAGETRTETIEMIAVDLPTRKGAIWRSALFPGMGQYYANNRKMAALFLTSELVALSVMTTGIILEQYYIGGKIAYKGGTDEKNAKFDHLIVPSYWTWVASLTAAGTIWAVNIVHAWAMPMSTKPTTAWQLIPVGTPNEAGLSLLISF